MYISDANTNCSINELALASAYFSFRFVEVQLFEINPCELRSDARREDNKSEIEFADKLFMPISKYLMCFVFYCISNFNLKWLTIYKLFWTDIV